MIVVTRPTEPGVQDAPVLRVSFGFETTAGYALANDEVNGGHGSFAFRFGDIVYPFSQNFGWLPSKRSAECTIRVERPKRRKEKKKESE